MIKIHKSAQNDGSFDFVANRWKKKWEGIGGILKLEINIAYFLNAEMSIFTIVGNQNKLKYVATAEFSTHFPTRAIRHLPLLIPHEIFFNFLFIVRGLNVLNHTSRQATQIFFRSSYRFRKLVETVDEEVLEKFN